MVTTLYGIGLWDFFNSKETHETLTKQIIINKKKTNMKKIFTLLAILVTFLGMGQTYSVNYTITTQLPTQLYGKQVKDRYGSDACSNATVIRILTASQQRTFMDNDDTLNLTNWTDFCPGGVFSSTTIAKPTTWGYLLNQSELPASPMEYTLNTDIDISSTGLDLSNKTYLYTAIGVTEAKYIKFYTVTLSMSDFEKSFSVYPNPTRDVVNIDLESEVSGEVYNLTGSLVLNFTSHEVDLSTLQPGVYFMKIFSEGMQCTKKIVKQ